MKFIKKYWLVLLAIPLCLVQPELVPLLGAALVAKLIAKYLK